MDRNFARALALVLKSEGGWSDNPADPGGATMKGVTLANFRRYVKADATKADLKKISDAQVATVYRRFYWDAVLGAELPDGIDYAVFDFAVNSGPGRATKYLQATTGVSQDGRIGPATVGAARARPAGVVIHQLCDARLAFLQRLPTWATFGRGWSDRVRSVRAQALLMSAPATVPALAQPAEPAPAPGPVRQPPRVEVPSGDPPAVGPASAPPHRPGIPVAVKAGGAIAGFLLLAYAAWHHIAVALQGIF
ncbi:glycosyl hydrolase 108 family protein [Mesorhizobium sp. B2-3-5]|uniref:glycoside hydrolase family 108 protein n=1 Tax=Mesorhizobium sp. B2-3-5 TaxID=2589958 RepID=UPI001FED7F49|nr:glycosyl hydrolase 108 family protein [Mesorhizobium sp. B2-3-5]